MYDAVRWRDPMPGAGVSAYTRSDYALLGLFLLVNALILWIAAVDAPARYGADAVSWLEPARALLTHGAFVDLHDPEVLLTLRPPLYPIVIAAAQLLTSHSYVPLIGLQVAMLAATALLTRTLVAKYAPGLATVAMALVLFNPSALGTAHLVQSDTMYAFAVMLTLMFVFRYAGRASMRAAIACGLAFGFVSLTRNTAQFLLYALPIALPVLVLAGRQQVSLLKAAGHGVIAVMVAFLVAMPWLIHMVNAGEGIALSSARIKTEFLWDNVSYLEKFEYGVGLTEAELRTRKTRGEFETQQGASWPGLSARVRHERMFAFGVEQFFSYSPTTYVRAYGWGAAQFFAVPGVSNVLNLLELNDRTPFAVFRATAYDNYLEAGLDALSEASPWAAAITIAGFALVIPLRLLGLIGIVVAWRRRLFPELAIICAVVAYFAIIHLFVGNSRYRLPVEPLLLLLAVYGWQGVHQWWLNRSRDDRAQAE